MDTGGGHGAGVACAAAPAGMQTRERAFVELPPVLLQVLTLVEHAVLLYRALLPTPAWVRYFEGAGLGGVLTAGYTGALPVTLSRFGSAWIGQGKQSVTQCRS